MEVKENGHSGVENVKPAAESEDTAHEAVKTTNREPYKLFH